MSAKVFELQCSPHLCGVMVAAIRGYVAVQYPPGVSDCALAAREALLMVADNIETVCQTEPTVSLSRRLRTMLKIAVNFYCDQRPASEAVEDGRAALLAALHRFSTTRNIQDAASATHAYCAAEADRLESDLSMIRYIAWAIPSIGFIGTVRGIGEALAQADKAVKGDIAGVTQSLGVAFNSTFIALLISIFLMFLVHQLQLLQERLVFDSEAYTNDKLIRHMKAD